MIAEVRAAMAARDWDRALALLAKCDDPQVHYLFSVCCMNSGDMEGALGNAQIAVMQNPSNAAAMAQLATCHYLMAGNGPDHYLEALMSAQATVSMAPGVPGAHMLQGTVLFTMGQLADALLAFKRAQDCSDGVYGKAALAGAGLGLLMGYWEEGWHAWEARHSLSITTPIKPYKGTLDELKDKVVVVRAEQGFGDNIQFMRYIPLLRHFCRDVIVEAYHGMESLIATFTDATVRTIPVMAETDQVQIAIMSLPLLLGPAIGWFPAEQLEVPSCFNPGKRSGTGICASCEVKGGAEVLYGQAVSKRKIPPIEYFGELASKFGPFRSLIHEDLETADWFETAAIVAGLKRVITVDTAVAHLAASLGVETWVLQRFDHCWRWDPRWYPNARIFKQPQPGDWASVFRDVEQALILSPG